MITNFKKAFQLIKSAASDSGYITLGEISNINKRLKEIDKVNMAMDIIRNYDLEFMSDAINFGKEIRYEIGWAGTGAQTKDRAVLRQLGDQFRLDIPTAEKEIKREIARSKHKKPRGPFTPEGPED